MRTRLASAVVAVVLGAAACGGAITIQPPAQPPTADTLKQLWVDPGKEPRDLFWGIGGQKYAPQPDALYTFKERDAVGFSTKYVVKETVDEVLQEIREYRAGILATSYEMDRGEYGGQPRTGDIGPRDSSVVPFPSREER